MVQIPITWPYLNHNLHNKWHENLITYNNKFTHLWGCPFIKKTGHIHQFRTVPAAVFAPVTRPRSWIFHLHLHYERIQHLRWWGQEEHQNCSYVCLSLLIKLEVLNYCMEQSPFWQADSCSSNKEITCFL
jgi:hypothetical protein